MIAFASLNGNRVLDKNFANIKNINAGYTYA